MGDRVISMITTGISKSIAVTSTAIAGQRRGSKQEKSNSLEHRRSIDSTSSNEDRQEGLELEWALDEATETEKDATFPLEEKKEANADSFLLTHQLTLNRDPSTYTRLPQLVSIPQRRPKDRSRGFVRAYAPILGECCGISSETFLDFIQGFDRATRTAPIFNVINIACIGLSFAGHVATIVSSVVAVANDTAKNMHKTYKGNKFLDEVNEKLFKPRGLYVLIMSYQPKYKNEPLIEFDDRGNDIPQEEEDDSTTTAAAATAPPIDDPTQAVAKRLTAERNALKKKLLVLKSTSGNFQSEQSIPPLAPLVYPMLDRSIDSGAGTASTSNQNQNQLALTKSTIAEYLDRRAQVRAAANHRNLSLAQEYPPLPMSSSTQPGDKEFVNRFCNPDHKVNSGSIFGLVTGGTWDPIANGRVRRAKKAAAKAGEPELTEDEIHNVYMGRGIRGRNGAHEKKRFTFTDNLLQKDLLYLCVVNLPTEAEVAEMNQRMKGA